METPQDDRLLVDDHDKDPSLPQTDQNNITPLNDENVYKKQAQAINDFVNSDLTKIKEDVPLSKDKKIDFSQKSHDDIKSENKVLFAHSSPSLDLKFSLSSFFKKLTKR